MRADVFIETENVRNFRQALSMVEDTKLGQPGFVIISGAAGRGKTEAARHHFVQTGCIFFDVWEGWSEAAMLCRLAEVCTGGEFFRKEQAKWAVVDFLSQKRKTILIDEADRLKPALVEHFRDIYRTVGTPMVFIGEERLLNMVYARKRQWSRVAAQVEFGPISIQDAMLYARRAADLMLSPEVAELLVKRAGGDFRLISRDLRQLELACRAAQTHTVEAAMINGLPDMMPEGRLHGRK